MSLSNAKVQLTKNFSVVLLLLALFLSLAGAWSIIRLNRTIVDAVPVAVAKVDIEPHTVITPDMLEMQEIARKLAKKGMLAGIEAAAGKINRTYIPAGTPLYAQQLSLPGDNTLATNLTDHNIPELRAKSIPVDPLFGLNGRVKPGDRVDLIGAMRVPLKGQQTLIAHTFAKNIEVLEIMGDQASMKGIIVAVDPQQAQDMDFVSRNGGTIGISLRPYKSSDTETLPTTPESFVQKFIEAPRGSSSTGVERGGSTD